MRVGFIGLGDQGGPMARRIIDAGHELTIWARRAASLTPFQETSAVVAPTPRQVAENSELVCVCVVDDADVEQVLTGPDGVVAGLDPGSIVAVHSTVRPSTCVRMAEVARSTGVVLLDAPVSGGRSRAIAGTLLVMVGGGHDAFQRCLPVFESFAGTVLHCGGVGQGQVVKLVNNALFAAQLQLAREAFELGGVLDVDRAVLAEALAVGSGRSHAVEYVVGLGGAKFALSDGARKLLRKDVSTLRELRGTTPAAGRSSLTGVAALILDEAEPA